MNATETDPHPFEFCPLFGAGDEVGTKHGVQVLAKSKVYQGSGARIQRVIHKALSGLPVTISVLGGSGTFFVQRYSIHFEVDSSLMPTSLCVPWSR